MDRDTIFFIIDKLSNATFLIASILAVFFALLVYMRKGQLKFGDFSLDLGTNIDAEADQIRRRMAEESLGATPAEKQFLLMSEYHAQGLAQSKTSFWFSLVFASIGFAVIIIAIFTVNRNADFMQQGQSFVSLVAGTIIEAVSALFFVQSNRARQLMTEFFDRLRVDRKMEESLRLVNEMSDEILKSRMQALLALNFVQAGLAENVLKIVLNLEEDEVNRNSGS